MTAKINLVTAYPALLIISLYLFFGNYIVTVTPIGKQIIALAALFFIFLHFFNLAINTKQHVSDLTKNMLYLLIVIFYLTIAVSKQDGSVNEFSIFVSIVLGLFLATYNDQFFLILKGTIFIQLILITFEFFTNTYIYQEVSTGLMKQSVRAIDINSYGEIGHRPKGLFSGPLEATSFYILSSLIFRKNKIILLLLLAMALMSNGRLSILVVSSVLITQNGIKFTSIRGILTLIVAMLTIFLGIYLQSDETIASWRKVFLLDSISNIARIRWYLAGFSELRSFDLFSVFFGRGAYFQDLYNHSAESGLLSQLLIHGVLWSTFLLSFIFYAGYKSGHYLVFMLLLICFVIYRIEAGFMRACLLWFLVFSSLRSKDTI